MWRGFPRHGFMGADMEFKITEDGTVVREDQTDIEITDKEEILSLEESVFRHPEFYSEQELSKKKKRLDELWKKMD